MSKKAKYPKLQIREWVSGVRQFETDAYECTIGGETYWLYPIWNQGQGITMKRTDYFLQISPKSRIFYYLQVANAELERLPLNLPDTVDCFRQGVANAPLEPLGKLQLMTCGGKVVYIVAKRVPAPPVASQPEPARRLVPAPT